VKVDDVRRYNQVQMTTILRIAVAQANQMRSQEFDDFHWILRLNGTRPGELRNAEAFNYEKWRDGRGRLVFRWNATLGYIHKMAKRTQRDWTIYCTPELQQYVERLVAKHPTGPLFRTPRGAKSGLLSISNKWTWLVKRPKVVAYCTEHGIFPRLLKPYFFRNSLISHYLDATGDICGIAQMYRTSVKMVSTRYGHLDVDKLHDSFLRYHGSKSSRDTRMHSPSGQQ